MLTRRWLPGDTANAIEAKQAEFRAEPEIPIGCLGHRVDVAHGEPVPDGPRGVRVLVDVERGVQGESAGAARQQNCQPDYRSSVLPLHAGIIILFPAGPGSGWCLFLRAIFTDNPNFSTGESLFQRCMASKRTGDIHL